MSVREEAGRADVQTRLRRPPLRSFLDHGQTRTEEPLANQLRPGNAGSNTAADHSAVTREALAQLPQGLAGRGSKKILIRTDGPAIPRACRSHHMILDLAQHASEALTAMTGVTSSAPPAPPLGNPPRPQRALRWIVMPGCQKQALSTGKDPTRPRSQPR